MMLPGDVITALRFEGPIREEAEESRRVLTKQESPCVHDRNIAFGEFQGAVYG